MKNKLIPIISIVAIILTALVMSIFAAPGDAEDPMVSLSYIEERFSQLKADYDAKIAALDPNGAVAAQTFKVVEVGKGKRLLAGEGTEMILRQGTAKVFASKKGGIANTTAGVDLADGTPAPYNSLMIVPLADGRGLIAETDLLVMVKGTYTLSN